MESLDTALARCMLLGALCVTGLAHAQNRACPEPRFTGKAPDAYYAQTNPVPASDAATTTASVLFQGGDRAANCAVCHGKRGDGNGPLARQYDPPPRNFNCARTIEGVPDGQLFWIIRFGSPGSAMPPHPGLSDEQVWQLVGYLRQLAR